MSFQVTFSPMRLTGIAFAGVALLGLASCASMSGESADAALQRANTAMGGGALKSISSVPNINPRPPVSSFA